MCFQRERPIREIDSFGPAPLRFRRFGKMFRLFGSGSVHGRPLRGCFCVRGSTARLRGRHVTASYHNIYASAHHNIYTTRVLYVVLDTALPEPHRAASDLVWPACSATCVCTYYDTIYVWVRYGLRYDTGCVCVRVTIRGAERHACVYSTSYNTDTT